MKDAHAAEPGPIEPAETSVAAFVDHFPRGRPNRAVRVLAFDEFDREFGGLDPASEASYGIREFFLNGGKEAWAVRASSPDGSPPGAAALVGDPAAKTGLHALDPIDFNLLCVPRAAGGGAGLPDGEARAALAAAISYCERRRAFFLMDTPSGINDAQAIADWLGANKALTHRDAALFYPRVRVEDPLGETRLRTVGASGAIAGLYARVDASRGVWKAAAGGEAVLRGVVELDNVVTYEQGAALNELGINSLHAHPVGGIVCFGARTLEGADAEASEWKYVPVRRTALMLEESLERGTSWAVFEPNDEPLWSRIRLAVGAFMNGLFRAGAFRGVRPQDAYLVKCDAETTTREDLERGVVTVVVGFAPLKPAEFTLVRIQQFAGRGEGYEGEQPTSTVSRRRGD